MSNLFIHVWTDASEVALGAVEQTMTVVIDGTSTQSSAIERNGSLARKRVRLFAEAGCHVEWGADPTAGVTSVPLGAENPEYFDIEAGHKIAVISRTVA